jgi:ABC-2 type transport system permease protein
MQAPKRNKLQQGMYLIGLYGNYLKMYVRTLAEYRADTFIALIAGLFSQGTTLVFLSVIFMRVPKLADWGFYEMVFMFGLAATGKAVNQAFFNMPFTLLGYIRRGQLDTLMVRPVGVLFQTIGMTQEHNALGQLVTGVSILLVSSWNLGLEWTPFTLIFAGIAIISSAVIQFAVLLAIAVTSFWVLEVRSIIYPVNWLYEFARYPLDIFHPILKGMMTYVIPYAVGSFFPAAFLLRPDQYGWAAWTVPLVAALIMLLSYAFWSFGLRRYSSAAG